MTTKWDCTRFRGQWHPGTHEPLVDRATWDRVQFLLGQKIYRSHEMTFGSEPIECGHCGCPITGEAKTKKTKSGDREYVYYRCARYHWGDHPRIRLTEGEIDAQSSRCSTGSVSRTTTSGRPSGRNCGRPRIGKFKRFHGDVGNLVPTPLDGLDLEPQLSLLVP